MKNILEQFFDGEVIPCEMKIKRTKEYLSAIDTVDKVQAKLLASLNDEEKELYYKCSDSRNIISGIESEQFFIYGFKLGAKLQTEILSGDK